MFALSIKVLPKEISFTPSVGLTLEPASTCCGVFCYEGVVVVVDKGSGRALWWTLFHKFTG